MGRSEHHVSSCAFVCNYIFIIVTIIIPLMLFKRVIEKLVSCYDDSDRDTLLWHASQWHCPHLHTLVLQEVFVLEPIYISTRPTPLIPALRSRSVQKPWFLLLKKPFWILYPEYVYRRRRWNTLQPLFFFNSLPGVHSSITEQEQASRSLHSRALTELRSSGN